MNSAPRCLRALLVLMAGLTISTVGLGSTTRAEPWRPMRPEDPVERLRLRSLPFSPETVKPGRTWTRVARGDTLRFLYRGEGELRIDVRPVIEDGDDSAIVRYGVSYDDGSTRRFLRRSAPGGPYAVRPPGGGPHTEQIWELGEADRHVILTNPDSRSLRFFLREDGASVVLVRCLVRGSIERRNEIYRSETRRALEWKAEIEAATVGYTDNAYFAPKSGPATRDAAFWPIRAEIELEVDDRLDFDFDARYEFEARFFDDAILDERDHRLDLDESWELGPRGPASETTLTLSQTLRAADGTFFGRGDLEEFETGSDPDNLSLADRFDYLHGELEAELALELGPRLEGIVDASYHRRDYDEDYPDEPDTYSLDQHRLRLGAELRWKLRRYTELRLEAEVRQRYYDEKFSRDADGMEIVDEPTRLRRWPIEIEFRHSPRVGLQLRLQARSLVTQDLYRGYWDRTTHSLRAEVGWSFLRGDEIEAGIRFADTSYDRSRVGNVPTGPIRQKDSLKWTLRGEFPLWSSLSALIEWEYVDRGNNSSLFAYERSTVIAGLAYRH